MDFFETVRARRSIRRFSDRAVAHEDILAMLEAATLAPSATNEQPWHFIVIRDKELKNSMRDVINAIVEASMAATDDRARKQRLARMRLYSTHFADAPVAIAVLARPWEGPRYSNSSSEPSHRDLGIESVAMATAQLQLAATALGYSCCFSSGPAEFAREELEAMLGVEKPWFLLGIISLGTPSKPPRERPPRKLVEEVCTFIG
ncbi:MAG TPA: nitroreductase family protein [Dehalococcoidia bacterium]|nr:nitroreductase family protein [Dehalococcoidia bacterium]